MPAVYSSVRRMSRLCCCAACIAATSKCQTCQSTEADGQTAAIPVSQCVGSRAGMPPVDRRAGGPGWRGSQSCPGGGGGRPEESYPQGRREGDVSLGVLLCGSHQSGQGLITAC